MSPVSRGRKGRKPHGPPRRKIAHRRPRTVEDDFALLASLTDPLDVEGFGASYLIAMPLPDLDAMVAALEPRASPDALALLLAVGAVARDELRDLLMGAADRLAVAGVPDPAWAADLRAPVVAGECLRMADDADLRSWLGCTFHRAGRSHGLLVAVDDWLDGVAREMAFSYRADLHAVLDELRAEQPSGDFTYTIESVPLADFTACVEHALDARDDRDLEIHPRRETDDEYLVAEVIARARLDAVRRLT